MRRSSFLRIRNLFERKDKEDESSSTSPKLSSRSSSQLPIPTLKGPKEFHAHTMVWKNGLEGTSVNTVTLCDVCFEPIQSTGCWKCSDDECGADICKCCGDLAMTECSNAETKHGTDKIAVLIDTHAHPLEWVVFSSLTDSLSCTSCAKTLHDGAGGNELAGAWCCCNVCMCNECRIAKEAVVPLEMGVSVRLLNNLSQIFPEQCVIDHLCGVVKQRTCQDQGYRSFAMNLFRNPYTRRLVRPQADVFVSYAWKGSIKATMDALSSHLLSNTRAEEEVPEDTFIWLDVVIVDQHAAAETSIDFEQWAETFKSNLLRTKKALLVLTPAKCPIAITRSWCCFEWVCIVNSGIPFEYCMNPVDARDLVAQAKQGLKANFFVNILSKINIERATAFKESDQQSILTMMRNTGVIEVNDIIMKSIKQWLLSVLSVAETEATTEGNKQELAEVQLGQGQLHLVLGEFGTAERYFRAAISTKESFLGRDHPGVAVAINNIAMTLNEQGRLEDALVMYKEALEIWEKAHGRIQVDVGTCKSNLATLYLDLNRPEEAEPLLREALDIFQNLFGPSHPDVSTTMGNLANLLQHQGKLNEAEQIFRNALSSQETVFGPDHPDVATVRHNLASLLERMGRCEEAKEMFNSAITVYTRVFGRQHPDTLRSINSLALVLARQNKYQEAESLNREVLAIREQRFGRSHPNVAVVLNNLAGVLEDQGKHQEAESMYCEALQIAESTLGKDHPHSQTFAGNLEQLLQKVRRSSYNNNNNNNNFQSMPIQ